MKHPFCSIGDIDTEISPYVHITPMLTDTVPVYDPRFKGQDPVTKDLHFEVRYHLDTEPDQTLIEPDRALSEGSIELYDPLLNLKTTITLQKPDMTLGDHQIPVTIPNGAVSELGTYTFLIHVRDSHDDKDKGHRKRWALSNCNQFAYQRANLTDPVDDDAPQLFRGMPSPCPVVIKGQVMVVDGQDTNQKYFSPVLSYTYTRGYWDDQMKWIDVNPEAIIPVAQQTNITTDSAGGDTINFRMTWQQTLPRTRTLNHQEVYRVRAYVITKPLQTEKDRTFRVLTMAAKDPGDMFSGFGKRDPTGAATTYGVSTDFKFYMTASPPASNLSDFHWGQDWRSAAGDVVYAAETGIVNDGDFVSFSGGLGGISDGTMDLMKQSAATWISNHANANLVVQLDLTHVMTWDNNNNLGPNREVDHSLINLSVIDPTGLTQALQYNQERVKTKYGHGDEKSFATPANGTKVQISTRVELTGDWYWPPNADSFRSPASKQQLLARGWFSATGAIVNLVDLNNRDANNNNVVVDTWPDQLIGFPSLGSPHLHLEVRFPSKANGTYFGQQDPAGWLYLRFPVLPADQ